MKRGVSAVSPKASRRRLIVLLRTVLEFDERILGPEPLLELLPGDHLPRMLDECEQDLERLLVKFDSDALLAQLSRPGIHLERAETNRRMLRGTGHIVLFSHCGEQRDSSTTSLRRTEDSLKAIDVTA